MTAEAIIDIPTIPRINELESVRTRRHSTGKVIIQYGGVTVLSRYLRTSQGSCHDICKYGTSYTHETESKSPRSPMPKIATLKLAGTGRILERSESNLGERRKKSEISLKLSPGFKIREVDDPVDIKLSGYAKPQKPDYPDVSLKPSADDMVDIKTVAAEGETQDEESDETKLLREKKLEVCLKPFPGSNSQKPFDPDCIESEVSSGTDKEFVSPKEVLLPLKETDVAMAHARDSKMRPQSKTSSCSSGRQSFEGSKSKETNPISMTPVSSGKNKGEMTIRKGLRTSVMGDKNDVMAPSVSLFPEESSTSISSMNAKKKKSSGVCRSKKHENAKQIRPERSSGKNAEGSKNRKGVSHLMDQENVKKPDSKEGSSADIPEKTLVIIKPNRENKPAVSIQNSVHASDFSTMPSSSSKDKRLKHTRNRVPIGQSPRYEKKNMIYRPKGIHARRLPQSLTPYPGKKDLRSSPYVTHPSLSSSSLLTSSKSPHGDALSQHDEVAAQKPNSGSKLMCKGRPKVALITTSKDKRLHGEKLYFQKGKVIEVRLEDYTPRRLAFKLRGPIDKRNGDNTKEKVEDCTPKRLKFRRRVLLDNRTGDNQNRGEEFTPRRLTFRRRVLVDDKNDENHNDRGEDCTPKRLKFRRRVLADNRTGDNQKGGYEFTPRRLKFGQRVLVDNRNDDNHNDGAEDRSPWKLKLRQRVLDISKTGYIPSSVGDTSKNNSKGKEANVGQDNTKEVQYEKISLRHNDVEKKKDSGSLYNNLIEETARRLVRTKSSKVKALVSAFETVISHLDTTISATNDIH